jgi:hypothetical protein
LLLHSIPCRLPTTKLMVCLPSFPTSQLYLQSDFWRKSMTFLPILQSAIPTSANHMCHRLEQRLLINTTRHISPMTHNHQHLRCHPERRIFISVLVVLHTGNPRLNVIQVMSKKYLHDTSFSGFSLLADVCCKQPPMWRYSLMKHCTHQSATISNWLVISQIYPRKGCKCGCRSSQTVCL